MITQEEILHRFLTEGGRDNPRFLKGTPGYGLHVDDDGQLCLMFGRRTSQGTRERPLEGAPRGVVLAKWAGNRYAPPAARACILLNGDGFDDQRASDWQTRLRTLVQNTRREGFTNPEATGGTLVNWALIPFMAFDGARIDKDTVRVVQQTGDRQERRFQVRNWNQKDVQAAILAVNPNRPNGGWSVNNRTFADSTRREFQGTVIIKDREYNISINESKISGRWTNNGMMIMWAPENAGRANWHNLAFANAATWGGGQAPVVDESGMARLHASTKDGPVYPGAPEFAMWEENVHRLGASVFTAVGFGSERRHQFLSAFDQQEPQPLYFLAQLPDGKVIKTYDEAIQALAPPIVHAARAAGKEVYRHGDVFAVEVSYDDKQLAKMDVQSWTCRDVVLLANEFGANPQWTERSARPKPKVVKPEWFTFNDPCPHCAMLADVNADEHTYPQVNGPTARRWLSIYRTGHTADFVVVLKDGRTFLKGRMFHDPHLEDPERRAGDHQIIALGNSTKWFLAVRNTVPTQADGAGSDSSTPADQAAPEPDAVLAGDGGRNGSEQGASGTDAGEAADQGSQEDAGVQGEALAEALA